MTNYKVDTEETKFILRGDILSLDKAFQDAGNILPIVYNGYTDDLDSVSGIFSKSLLHTDSRDFLYDIAFCIHNRFQNIKTEDIVKIIDINDETSNMFYVNI